MRETATPAPQFPPGGSGLSAEMTLVPRPRRDRTAIVAHLPIVLGLPEMEAAAAIGVSASKFRGLVAEGLMPEPRDVGGKLSYDIDELRAAYKAMPHRNEAAEVDTWADLKPKANTGV
jgi:hypothetical protein